jgi:small-conductance mechanosensitive channel
MSLNDIAGWLAQHDVSLIAVLATLALLVVAPAASHLIKRALQGSLRQPTVRLRLPYETVSTIARAVTAVIWIIAAALVLEIWGIGVGGLWTVLVSATAVIGVGFLATWTMVSNITASFFIAIWRPFHLGDTVEILPENLKGRVIDNNLMFLKLRESSGAVMHIPNNLFFQKMFRVTGTQNRSAFEEFESDADFARSTGSTPHAARAERDPVLAPAEQHLGGPRPATRVD